MIQQDSVMDLDEDRPLPSARAAAVWPGRSTAPQGKPCNTEEWTSNIWLSILFYERKDNVILSRFT